MFEDVDTRRGLEAKKLQHFVYVACIQRPQVRRSYESVRGAFVVVSMLLRLVMSTLELAQHTQHRGVFARPKPKAVLLKG